MVEERKEKTGAQSEEQINIQEILFRYLIHWPWFVVSVIVCIALAWGYLRLTTPIYNVSATVLIKDEKKGGGANMSSELEKMGLNGFVSSSSNIENEIEVLSSRTLAREVVSSLGLFVTYMDEDRFPKRELYRTSPVLVSLTPQEADNLPQAMEVGMSLQPTGAMDVQIKVGKKSTGNVLRNYLLYSRPMKVRLLFSLIMIPCHQSIQRVLRKSAILRLTSTALFPWRKDMPALCQ